MPISCGYGELPAEPQSPAKRSDVEFIEGHIDDLTGVQIGVVEQVSGESFEGDRLADATWAAHDVKPSLLNVGQHGWPIVQTERIGAAEGDIG